MSARTRVGFSPLRFSLPLGFFFGNPGFPGISGRRIFAGERDRGNIGIRNFAQAARLRKHLQPRLRARRLAVKQVSDNLLARLQRECHIAAIIKRELDGLGQFSRCGGTKYPALQLRMFRRMVFGIRHKEHCVQKLTLRCYRALGESVTFTVRPNPDQDPNVSATADASYPQWTMQSAHFSFRPVPYWSHSVASINSWKVFA